MKDFVINSENCYLFLLFFLHRYFGPTDKNKTLFKTNRTNKLSIFFELVAVTKIQRNLFFGQWIFKVKHFVLAHLLYWFNSVVFASTEVRHVHDDETMNSKFFV